MTEILSAMHDTAYASTGAVTRVCGNCRFFTPPKPLNQCGLCTVRGSFAGTLRPQPEFSCLHFAATTARRMPGDEESC